MARNSDYELNRSGYNVSQLLNKVENLARVAETGSYSDLTNKPTIPPAVEANPTIPEGTTPTNLQNLKVGSDCFSIPQSVPEVFWATYNVTTVAEIDAAIVAGMAVMCKYNEHIYRLEDYRTNQPLYFSANVSSQVRSYLLLNRSNNSWSNSSITAELSSFKSQSVETDKESTTKYPSTKAVADALATKYEKPQGGIPASDLANGVIPVVPVQNVTLGGTSVVSNGVAALPSYPEDQFHVDYLEYVRYEDVEDWMIGDGKPIVLFSHGWPRFYAGMDDSDSFVFVGFDNDGQMWKFTLGLNGWLPTEVLSFQPLIDSQHKLDYSLLSNTPTIPAAQVNADWNANSGVAQILNKPTIPTALSDLSEDTTHRVVTDTEKSTWDGKQDELPIEVGGMTRNDVSGTGNITVRNTRGKFANVVDAGTYDVIVEMQSATADYGISVTFGANSYNLTSDNGVISDKRTLTVAANSSWAGTLSSAVAASTYINVSIRKRSPEVLSLVAETGDYASLSNKPTLPTVESMTAQEVATAVQTAWDAVMV